MIVLLFTILVLFAQPAWATIRYVDSSLGANCSGNYNVSTRACDANGDSDAYTTANTSTALGVTEAGDTLYFRAGTYATGLAIVAQTVTGTSSQRVVISGYPGETVIFQPTGHLVASGSATDFITFKNFKADFVNAADDRSFDIRNSEGLTFEDLEVTNAFFNGFYLDGVSGTTTFRRVKIHGQRSDCGPGVTGNRFYGIYAHHGANLLVEDSDIYDNPGGGMQIYPGPWTSAIVRNSRIYENTWCTTSNVGGIIALMNSGSLGTLEIYNNLIYGQSPADAGGWGGGITTGTGSSHTISNTKINNNTIYNNSGNGGPAYGINIQGAVSGEVKNNHVVGNETGQILDNSTGSLTVSNNRTTGSITDCTVSTTDLQLKQGANSCVDAGASVTTRPSPVGVTDIGAFERGTIASAIVSGAFIEVTVSVGTAPILPSTGITQFTIANGTSTGTPVVTQAVRKSGSSNVIQLSISGFTGSGTCTISYGAGNLTDSGYVGPAAGANLGTAQGVNSASGVSVSGTCNNTSGDPTPPSSGLYSEFLLDEGAGTTATDNTINGNDGTVSAGVTWVDDTSGTGVTIPSDTTYRHIASTHGQGVDLTANSLSACVTVLPDTQYAQKVVLSSGGNGINQRFYAGWYTVNGAAHWGIGVQGSGMSTVSEFPVVAQKTLVCIRANAATDTVTLSVGRTIGTSAGAVKTYSTSLVLVDDIRAGNDGTFTVNTGGMTIYEMWVWNNTYVSDADVQALYDSIFSEGGSVGGYTQQDFQAQRVYLDGSSNPINYGSAGAASVEVIAGGAVALVMQVDCTGGDCGPLAMQWLYAKNGGPFEHGIPLQFTADGIAMWGSDTDASLNRFTVADCVSGALTENYGPTQLVAGATPTIELAQNHSYCLRAIVKFQSDQAGNYFQIKLGQDNGADLAGGAVAIPRINVVAPRASGGY